jgi:hypothetical protein
MQLMSKNPPSKDEALEALDFIVNVLKEHEKDLDRLIGELGTVTEQLGQTGELSGKIEKVEERINGLQTEIAGLVTYLSTSPREEAPIAIAKEQGRTVPQIQPGLVYGPAVILRCRQWEDFQTLASQANTVSFSVKEGDKTFQVDALKGNQVITFTGELPGIASLLKSWLSQQLGVSEQKVLEGVLTTS